MAVILRRFVWIFDGANTKAVYVDTQQIFANNIMVQVSLHQANGRLNLQFYIKRQLTLAPKKDP